MAQTVERYSGNKIHNNGNADGGLSNIGVCDTAHRDLVGQDSVFADVIDSRLTEITLQEFRTVVVAKLDEIADVIDEGDGYSGVTCIKYPTVSKNNPECLTAELFAGNWDLSAKNTKNLAVVNNKLHKDASYYCSRLTWNRETNESFFELPFLTEANEIVWSRADLETTSTYFARKQGIDLEVRSEIKAQTNDLESILSAEITPEERARLHTIAMRGFRTKGSISSPISLLLATLTDKDISHQDVTTMTIYGKDGFPDVVYVSKNNCGYSNADGKRLAIAYSHDDAAYKIYLETNGDEAKRLKISDYTGRLFLKDLSPKKAKKH